MPGPKLDLAKALSHLYMPSAKEIVAVDVPPMSFLMVDGKGDPNTSEKYKNAIQSLYSVSYTLKFAVKKAGGQDFGVMPLESLWWADNGDLLKTPKDRWQWTAMILQPDFIQPAQVQSAADEAEKRGRLPVRPRFEQFEEGKAAQVLYIGPYADEGPTIQRIHDFIEAHGGQLRGKHHEIYLGDPRRTEPSKLKTVIRQPFG